MKMIKRLLPLLLVVAVLLSLGIGAYADYGYKVRVFAGNQGTITGSAVFSDVPYDEEITFSIANVKVSNTKYVVRGLRESGKDNAEILTPGSSGRVTIHVRRDQDYVVSYGIPGNEVALTIRCVTANGTYLNKQETFYGEPNTTILIKTPYVEGYRPSANFARAKLGTTDRVENITYTPVTTTATVIETGGGTGGGTGVGTGGGNIGGNTLVPVLNPDTDTDDEDTDDNDTFEDMGDDAADFSDDMSETEDILDLDVPLAEPDAEDTEFVSPDYSEFEASPDRIPTWALILAGVLLVLLIGLAFWYFLFYRKKKKRDEEDVNYEDYNIYVDK